MVEEEGGKIRGIDSRLHMPSSTSTQVQIEISLLIFYEILTILIVFVKF